MYKFSNSKKLVQVLNEEDALTSQETSVLPDGVRWVRRFRKGAVEFRVDGSGKVWHKIHLDRIETTKFGTTVVH